MQELKERSGKAHLHPSDLRLLNGVPVFFPFWF